MKVELNELAASIVAEGVAPVVAVGFAVRTFGAWIIETGGAAEELFDLASLTKPVFAASIARAGIGPKKRLSELDPAYAGTPVAGATVEQLLSHRAGLEAHVPLYLSQGEFNRTAALQFAAASVRTGLPMPVAESHAYPPLYSDLGYILLGEAVSTSLKDRDASDLMQREVIDLLGLGQSMGAAQSLMQTRPRDLFVPTEVHPIRGPIRGEVHDDNAWALTGLRASGHAGLFGGVESVLRFACHVAECRSDYEWLLKRRPGGVMRAGFDGKSEEGSSAGEKMSSHAVGHLGFTGTSFWLDLDKGVAVAFLSNRVCPSRENQRIKDARPKVHDRLVTLAERFAKEAFRRQR